MSGPAEKWPEHLASVKVDENNDPIFTDAWTNEERLVACAIMGMISEDVSNGPDPQLACDTRYRAGVLSGGHRSVERRLALRGFTVSDA